MSPLLESVRRWVLRNLPHDRADPQVVAALAVKEPSELLIWYLNWRSRFPQARLRRVFKSRNFERSAAATQLQSELAQIVDDIEQGRTLRKYLSKDVEVGFKLPKKPGKKKLHRLEYLDLLLNDWGIHHLHISTALQPNGFVTRGNPLIFAAFKDDCAYLIDIGKHGDWGDDHLVRIIVETWPEAGLVHEFKGIQGSQGPPTNSSGRLKLRSSGLTRPVEIDGRSFSPSLGLTTAGTSSSGNQLAQQILIALKKFEAEVAADPISLVGAGLPGGPIPLGSLKFEFDHWETGYVVWNFNTGFSRVLVRT